MGLGMRRTLHGDGRTPAPGAVVRPDERLSWPRTAGLGAQHVVDRLHPVRTPPAWAYGRWPTASA